MARRQATGAHQAPREVEGFEERRSCGWGTGTARKSDRASGTRAEKRIRTKVPGEGEAKGEEPRGREGRAATKANARGSKVAGTKYKTARGRRTEKRWGGEATRQEGKEEKAGDGTSPHGGGEVAGRWVLLDGEIPVLVPPLGSHQPDKATKPRCSVGPRGP